jgi:hypothetical protein
VSPIKHVLTITIVSITIAPLVSAQTLDWSRAKAEAADTERKLSVAQGNLVGQAPSKDMQNAWEQYYIASLKHRQSVFAWQAFASKIIFVIVIALVFAGLVFSALQFYFGLRGAEVRVSEEFEVSLSSVKVRTQFLGIVTLALSLAFFYLYLSRVYPIVPVGTLGEAATAQSR